MTSVRSISVCALSLGLAVLAGAPLARAAGPEVRSLMPSGGQRGATLEVAAGGNFPLWPVQAWVDRAGSTITATDDKGKLAVAIAPDAATGVYWIRLYDAQGAAAPRPFVVGTLAEVLEQEPNNSPAKAQPISTPNVIVNGRLGATGDVDTFAVPLQKGQTLVAALVGNETLGSPMDSVLEVVVPRGNVLAFNHDAHGLDPRIEFTAPADGAYLVRTFAFPSAPNSTIAFAGGDQFVYRLTLTAGPFADYPWPLAVTRSRETRVELLGWNIPTALASVLVKAEGETAGIFDPQLAAAVPLAVEAHNTIVEVEPNDPAAAQPIELPITVSGRIENRRDVDAFVFFAKKGQPLAFQVESRALGYPLDAVLEVTDGTGKSLLRVDDTSLTRDAAAVFSPPDDGAYRVLLSDLNRQGSARHVYRLRAVPAASDFEITADNHAYLLAAGKPAEITLSIARNNGFQEEIAFEVTGLPSFVTAAAAQSSPQGDSAKTVKLALSASAGTFSGPIRVVGRAGGASKRVRTAGVDLAARGTRTSDLWLTVTDAK